MLRVRMLAPAREPGLRRKGRHHDCADRDSERAAGQQQRKCHARRHSAQGRRVAAADYESAYGMSRTCNRRALLKRSPMPSRRMHDRDIRRQGGCRCPLAYCRFPGQEQSGQAIHGAGVNAPLLAPRPANAAKRPRNRLPATEPLEMDEDIGVQAFKVATRSRYRVATNRFGYPAPYCRWQDTA